MSALANAEHNYDMNTDELVVKEAYANEGPTLKRFRPRAQGRASAINKRTSHITIVVSDGKKKLKKLNKLLRREYCGSKINPSDFVSESSVTGKLNGMLKKTSLHYYTKI